MSLWLVVALVAVLVVAYLVKLNHAMTGTPDEVLKLSPHRWTEEEIRQAYAKVQENPVDFTKYLPPKLDRRYLITGGSGKPENPHFDVFVEKIYAEDTVGLVGGQLVLNLLTRGQPPESIRIVDFRKPNRDDMLSGPAAQVDFVQADITKPESVTAAFDKPWPSSVSHLPLTVFHTAAIINPGERSKLVYHRCSRVNLDGTKNVLAAAKAAECDIFIATSSASVALRPVKLWVAPWRRFQERSFQLIDESDQYRPLRDHYDYFGNYGASKAHAERCVIHAGEDGGEKFKTGCIRPANGIYGNKYDQTVGAYCDMEFVPTCVSDSIFYSKPNESS
jgi:nucleoside-diphosphate-sugar epimerase